MTSPTRAFGFAALILLLLVAIVLGLGAGAVRYSPREVVSVVVWRLSGRSAEARPPGAAGVIVWDLRLSRSLLAALVGASLAVSGAAFQGLFRNPLADPFVIGASSGAALGAAAAIALGITVPIAGFNTVAAAAFCGSIAAVALVYAISAGGSEAPPAVSLLLAGTALSSLFSAMVSLIITVRDGELHQIYFWLLGGFGAANWRLLGSILPYVLCGALALFFLARPLDLLAFGEDSARAMGLGVGSMRLLTVLAASLTTAAAVAVSGIIGFVGLIAPHMARLMFGPSHRALLPAAALIGAVLLVLADMAARTVLSPVELPVGILTSMLGAPFFLYLLKAKRQRLGGST